MARQVFNETQNYRGTWVMYVMIMTEVPLLILVFVVMYLTGTDPREMYQALGIIGLIILIIFFFLMKIELESRIDEKGIHYRFFPFILQWRLIPKEKIKSIEVITYSPLSDYGGWGLKGNKNTKAYSITGDEGILIDLGEPKKIMIGTKKAAELRFFLSNWLEE